MKITFLCFVFAKLDKNCFLPLVQRGQIVVLHKECYTERLIGKQHGCSNTDVH